MEGLAREHRIATRTYIEDRERGQTKLTEFAFRLLLAAGVCLIVSTIALITYALTVAGSNLMLTWIGAGIGSLPAAVGWNPDRPSRWSRSRLDQPQPPSRMLRPDRDCPATVRGAASAR